MRIAKINRRFVTLATFALLVLLAAPLYAQKNLVYINGNIAKAIEKWNECLEEDPGNTNVLANLKKAKSKINSIKKLQRGTEQ